jgi:hypothetical protein
LKIKGGETRRVVITSSYSTTLGNVTITFAGNTHTADFLPNAAIGVYIQLH